MRRALVWIVAFATLMASCSPTIDAGPGGPPARRSVRMLFGGDVMLGRGVAGANAADPWALLEDLRPVVASADLAVANLESPLTDRPHDPAAGPNALEAPPAAAGLLAAAGFDAMGVANNHAGDAGPGTVADTSAALEAAGLTPVGVGPAADELLVPVVVEASGVRVALLAFDASAVSSAPDVARWDEDAAREAVLEARRTADVVAVGLHGGLEYSPTTDRYLFGLAERLAGWGVDVVWGHGPHVVQPIRAIDPDGDGRSTIVGTSLGNLVFDQRAPGTRRGALLDVVASSSGVRAYRVGTTDQTEGRVAFRGWHPPLGDAVALDGGWWELAVSVTPRAIPPPPVLSPFPGDVVDAALGDPDGDGRTDAVVAFRRPYRATEVNALFARRRLVDDRGRTAHVGLYRPGDLRPRWVAGTLLRPVVAVAPCEGWLAIAYSTLDDADVVATGAWRWGGFGFVPLPDLTGRGRPACADIDGDGAADPLILGRSS